MKNVKTIFFFLASVAGYFSLYCNAEGTPNKTVVEGRTWNYTVVSYERSSAPDEVVDAVWHYESGFHFEGEEVVGGKAYSILRDGNGERKALMREDDGKVYLRTGNVSADVEPFIVESDFPSVEVVPEVLLYDFNLQQGDNMFIPVFYDNSGSVFEADVVDVTEYSYNSYNTSRQVIQLFSHTYDILEGIGPTEGKIWGASWSPYVGPTGMFSQWSYLRSVTDSEGNVIYDNPEAEIPALKARYESARQLYNLQGMPIERAVPGSIVIRDGKKILWK